MTNDTIPKIDRRCNAFAGSSVHASGMRLGIEVREIFDRSSTAHFSQARSWNRYHVQMLSGDGDSLADMYLDEEQLIELKNKINLALDDTLGAL